ncbi:MAG: AAA family ATPase, partial [Duodenibacillus sp.]|nr:AAA family ATPase [Duodenibacillus sp.]
MRENSQLTARNLPLGISQFDAVIEGGMAYVDKTGLVFEMVSSARLAFLARPRRFGKSLLVSTLKSLFQGRLELFRGLEIAGLWQEPARRVVTLNFAMAR